MASFDSEGKKKSFTRVWARFAEKTSMQGIPYIYNAKLLWAKVAWVILTFTAIGFMVWHLYFLIDQFYSFPKLTKIELGFDNLRFPDVTICNTNIIRKGRLAGFPGAEELKEVVGFLDPENLARDVHNSDNTGGTASGGESQPKVRRKRFLDDHKNFNFTDFNYKDPREDIELDEDEYEGELDEMTQIYNLFINLFMDLSRHDRAALGHNISDMLVSCTFNDRICDDRMFRLLQTAEYGNCWTISSPKFVSRSSGPSAGLQLILYMETDEYLPGITNGYGARISINQPSTYPIPYDEGLYISSAMETSIGLKMIQISRQGQPYGDCDDGDSFFNQYNTTYTRQVCQLVCVVNYVLAYCKCFEDGTEDIAIGRNSSYRPCRSDTELECMINITRQFEEKKLECTCHNPCQETQYAKSLSQRQWPSDDYAAVLLESICDYNPSACGTLMNADSRSLGYNFLKLNIYYEDLNFENITEEPEIQTTQFLSDVGGAIGLWIGLSVLAFCEVFQLVIELCDYGIHKIRKNKRRERERAKRRSKRRQKVNNMEKPPDEGPKFGQWPNTEFKSYTRREENHHTNYTDYKRYY